MEQTEKIREMNENSLTMLDYEKVLETVKELVPQIQGGKARMSMRGGAHFDDEEEKKQTVFSINLDQQRSSEKIPLMDVSGGDVSIAHIAGTIELDERPRLKKLIFRATRGKALTYFREFDLPAGLNQKARKKAVYLVVF